MNDAIFSKVASIRLAGGAFNLPFHCADAGRRSTTTRWLGLPLHRTRLWPHYTRYDSFMPLENSWLYLEIIK